MSGRPFKDGVSQETCLAYNKLNILGAKNIITNIILRILMRKKVLVTAILCCIVNMAFAQMTLKGKVVDENEKPVAGASVWIEYTTLGTSTDENGEFSLQRVPEGKHRLRASTLDYNGAKIDIASSREDILFVLKKSPLKLNEVVVTGTGTHNRLKNTPVAMDMITKKELENINVPTFENAMMSISPSFSFMTNAMGSYMQMNGLSNRYILVLVDGKKLAGDVSGNTDLSRINMKNVKRIEVLKGAASALYGSEAMGGVINIITENPKESIYITSDTRYAEYGQFSQAINADVNYKWLSSSTSFQRNQSDGWQLNTQETSGDKLIDTDKMAVNTNYSDVVSQKFTVKPAKSLSIYAEGSLYDKKLKRPVSSYAYNMKYEDYNIGAGARYMLKDLAVITLDLYTDNFEYYREYIKDDGNYKNGDESKERRQKYYDANLKGIFNLGKYNRLSVGTQYQLDYIESQSDTKDGSRDVYTYSVYAQDEIKLLDSKLQFVPGFRYVYNEAFGNRLTPKLSGMYSLDHFNFRASYSAGFRAPDMKELYTRTITRSTLSLGNSDLKPESSNYYSLNTEYHNDFLTVSVTGYINRIKNIIQTRDVTETITEDEKNEGIKKKQVYTNSSRARVNGFETSVNSYLGAGLSIGLGYSYVNSKDYDTGKPLVRSSKHIGTGNVNWNKKWWIVDSNINFNGRIQSSRYMGDKDPARAYNQWNLATRHRLKNFNGFVVEPGFGIENIFDFVDDKPFGANYATLSPGRVFYVSLSLKFSK